MKNANIRMFSWLVIVIAIIVGALMPQVSFPDKYNLDKIAHFGGYFFAALISIYLLKFKKKYLLAIFILVLTAIGTEVAQMYIVGRTGSYGDAIANISGVITGFAVGHLFNKRG
ncbi:MAG: VanZ family protein [Proteobacteria bacterium]|nr:VanZ family protein [Pseudomonadota bacterium]